MLLQANTGELFYSAHNFVCRMVFIYVLICSILYKTGVAAYDKCANVTWWTYIIFFFQHKELGHFLKLFKINYQHVKITILMCLI